MRTQLIEKGGNKFLVVQVHPNFEEGFVSKSGKSWVQRVRGTYIKRNGEIRGEKGKLSGYISHPFGFTIVPLIQGQRYSRTATYFVSEYDFGDDYVLDAVAINVKEII